MFNKEYDVVVVGVGPAGSAAAKICAENGLSVIAFEKRQEIGAPKRCGEGLYKSFRDLDIFDFNEKWVCNNIIHTSFTSPDGTRIEIDFEEPCGWTIERKLFDKDIACQAASAGAKIFAKSEVKGILRTDDGKVLCTVNHAGDIFEVKCKVVIACDGVESKISRMAGIDTKLKLSDIAGGVQFEMAGIDVKNDAMEFFFGSNISPGGYVWIFPKGDGIANVGIGIRRDGKQGKDAVTYLRDFISGRPELAKGSIIEYNTGGVPAGGILKDMVSDNVIVAGDAAHHGNPIHGGGIIEALEGGMIAGRAAVKAIERGDYSKKGLWVYNNIWNKECGKTLKNLEKLRHVFDELKDDELDFLARELSGDDLMELSGGKALKKLAKILMKRPGMIRLARKLL